jgi:2-polyprenyl-3-methyl-5-hydroxy-6-metoxy-1,4-benzoquinol methylase
MSDTPDLGRYQHDFVEGGSYKAAVELAARSGRNDSDGIVVDVGCGYGAVAEPLRDLGYTYVGTDLAPDGLDDLSRRGFETHVVDLGAPRDELRARLDEIAADRDVALVLTLDVLEHLVDPGGAAAVLAGFASDHGAGDLVVSYPNITHLDVAAKLLAGRWDRTDEGLLDRTHLQFFTDLDLLDLLAGAGWEVEDRADVVSEHSDQSFPNESPVLRPDTPLRDLLRSVRQRAEPSGATYQFVRRYRLRGDPRPESASAVSPGTRFATVILVRGNEDGGTIVGRELVEADLAEQSYIDFELVIVESLEELGPVIDAAAGRYVVLLTGHERLTSGWMAAFCDAAADDAVRGRVLRAEVGRVPLDALGSTPAESLAELAAGAEGLAGETFDPLAADPAGAVVPAAFAVPTAVAGTLGLRPEAIDGESAVTVFLARCVQLAGLSPVSDLAVLCAESTAPGFLSDGVVEALGRDPYLLSTGSAERLLARRELAATARDTEARLQIALTGALEHARGVSAQRDDRVDALTVQLQRLQTERDALVAALARAKGERRRKLLSLDRWRRPQ